MLIAIAGAIGSGKSAIAARLAERYGFRVVHFADALREEVMARLPLTLRAMHDAIAFVPASSPCLHGDYDACIRHMVYVTKPPTFRALLQEYGSEVRRADDPDYWVKRWAKTATDHLHGRPVGCCVVSPDCRFPNEAKAVRDMGGLLWKVERPGHTGSGHVSETALSHWFDWDAVIVNDGTLIDLYCEVDRLLRGRTCAQADGAA